MDNYCCGRPKSSWAPPKGMRGKCERRGGNINAGAAGAEVFAGDELSRERLFCPWLQFHGVGRADVYIIIRVRASGCGESALNPPTSPPIPRRRPAPAPAQRRALPEHFRSPTQRDAFLADPTTHSPPKAVTRPRTTTRPSRTLSHPLPLPSCHIPAAPTHTRRLRDTFLVEDLLPSPSVPLRAQKNGTAQWMCDAECLGRPSLRSVIGVGEPRAVRRRCGALACRRGA